MQWKEDISKVMGSIRMQVAQDGVKRVKREERFKSLKEVYYK